MIAKQTSFPYLMNGGFETKKPGFLVFSLDTAGVPSFGVCVWFQFV